MRCQRAQDLSGRSRSEDLGGADHLKTCAAAITSFGTLPLQQESIYDPSPTNIPWPRSAACPLPDRDPCPPPDTHTARRGGPIQVRARRRTAGSQGVSPSARVFGDTEHGQPEPDTPWEARHAWGELIAACGLRDPSERRSFKRSFKHAPAW